MSAVIGLTWARCSSLNPFPQPRESEETDGPQRKARTPFPADRAGKPEQPREQVSASTSLQWFWFSFGRLPHLKAPLSVILSWAGQDISRILVFPSTLSHHTCLLPWGTARPPSLKAVPLLRETAPVFWPQCSSWARVPTEFSFFLLLIFTKPTVQCLFPLYTFAQTSQSSLLDSCLAFFHHHLKWTLPWVSSQSLICI